MQNRDFTTEGTESTEKPRQMGAVVVLPGLASVGCAAKAAARPPHSKSWAGCAPVGEASCDGFGCAGWWFGDCGAD
jgi:hypothetical protein